MTILQVGPHRKLIIHLKTTTMKLIHGQKKTHLSPLHQIMGNSRQKGAKRETIYGILSGNQLRPSSGFEGKEARSLATSRQKLKPEHEKHYVPNKRFPGSPKNSVTSLAKVKDLTLASSLFVIQKALGLSSSYLSLGQNFNFSLDSCYLTTNNNLVITSINNGEKTKDEALIVGQIVDEVKKICGDKRYDDFMVFLKRAQSKVKCDFKYTLSLLQSYCFCSKIQINNKIEFIQNKDGLLNPESMRLNRKYITSLGHSRSTNSRRKTLGESEASLPSFLKLKLSKSLEKKEKKLRKKSQQISNHRKLICSIADLTKSNQQTPTEINSQGMMNLNFAKPSKESQASTDFKTSTNGSSLRGDCVESFTFQGKFGSPLTSNIQTSNRSIPVGKEPELSQVQSQCESSQNQKEGKLESMKISESRVCEPFNEQKLYENNQWTRKYDNLFSGDDDGVMQSFVEGKDQESHLLGNEHLHLGKLARAMVESYLPQLSCRKNPSRLFK